MYLDMGITIAIAITGIVLGYALGFRRGYADNIAVKVEKILVEQFQITLGDKDD